MGTDSVRMFFTADTHFGHRLMALHRGHAPGADSRDDVTLEQLRAHDEGIVTSWNSVVNNFTPGIFSRSLDGGQAWIAPVAMAASPSLGMRARSLMNSGG